MDKAHIEYLTQVTQYWHEADKNNYNNIDPFPHEVFFDKHPFDVDWNEVYPYYKISGIEAAAPAPGKASPTYKDHVSFDGDLNDIATDELINDNVIRFVLNTDKYGFDSDDTSNSASPLDDKNKKQKKTQSQTNKFSNNTTT